jgi:iron complex outermembrane receptor protein
VSRLSDALALRLVTCGIMMSLLSTGVAAQTPSNEQDILANLSFEELSKIQVTTPARRPESLFDTTAAVSVLTAEDVRRSGAYSLADTLRYVPGMDVTRIQSPAWGVGARGFNGQFANQVLVMIDGRSVYNFSFGGVYWQTKDVFFDDIDRIEVVRGPGGSLWGANAVNGVVNILTKDARETQGSVVFASGGSFLEAGVGARYGFQADTNTFARVYVKSNQFGSIAGGREDDPWRRVQTGFRMDRHANEASHFTLQGDFYETFQHNPATIPSFTPPFSTYEVLPVRQLGANVLARWRKSFSESSALTVQGYWDFTAARNALLLDRRNVGDIEAQHDVRVGSRQSVVYGFNYRVLPDRIEPSRTIGLPGRETVSDQFSSVFAQDEIELASDLVFLTLGAKIEHNSYSGWETQPTARLRWNLSNRQMFWGAVSEAVSTPSRTLGMQFASRVVPPNGLGPGSPATLVQVQGRADESEGVRAYEAGYRVRPTTTTSIDVATFYNDYSDLRVLEPGVPDFRRTPPVLPVYLVNLLTGTTYGVETSASWQPIPAWQIDASHSYFHSDVARGSLNRADGKGSPQHKYTLQAAANFRQGVVWNAGLRFVDKLESQQIPSYLAFDTRLAWRPRDEWELAIVGQDLFDQHPESPSAFVPAPLEVPRSFYTTLTFRF